MVRCIRNSILNYIHLFYVKIFFRIFPWRYLNSLESVQKEAQNILNLTVLLTLLFLGTMLDIVFFALLGAYCYYLHPRREIYRKELLKQHRKYRTTLWFFANTLIEVSELLILLPCFVFKWKLAKQVFTMIITSRKGYSGHYWSEVFYVVKLTLVKIPSLVCFIFLLLSVYKYQRLNFLVVRVRE